MDFSFSGAGFMGCYYFGVVDCINKYIPRERVNRVAGASAGALIGAYYLMELPLNTVLKEVIDMLADFRRRPLGVFDRTNQLVDILPKLLDRLFPDDAHKQCSGRLFICMTRWKDKKKVIVSEFETKKDLIDALNCSSFIPVWSGDHIATYKGKKYADGGLSDNMPVFDEHTIRICCFAGPSDIAPFDRAKAEILSGRVMNTPVYLNFGNCMRFKKALFPPPAKFTISLLELGFQDTKKFLLEMDLIQCDKCYNKLDPKDRKIYSTISPTLTPSVSPAVSRRASFTNLNSEWLRNGGSKRKKSHLKPLKDANNNLDSSNSCKQLSMTQAQGANFASLLCEKLQRSCSPDSLVSSSCASYETVEGRQNEDDNNNNSNTLVAPTIIVEEANSTGLSTDKSLSCSSLSPFSSQLSTSSAKKPKHEQQAQTRPIGSEKFLAAKRASQAQIQGLPSERLSAVRDKFTLAPNPLPSCPPSPNLNRHCTECIRLRQQARLDQINESILEVAEDHLDKAEVNGKKLKSKLTSPIKWIRQLRVKSSYNFERTNPTIIM